MSLSKSPRGPVATRARLGVSQHFVTASDPAPEPWGKCGFSGRFSRGHTPITRQNSVRLPCPVDILALSASLFLGPGLAMPSSLAAPCSDSKNPSALQGSGAFSRPSPQASWGFTQQTRGTVTAWSFLNLPGCILPASSRHY